MAGRISVPRISVLRIGVLRIGVLRIGVLLGAVALLAAGCGSSGSAGPVGDTATGYPEFSGSTVDGERLVSADYAGQDVILWFWAPW